MLIEEKGIIWKVLMLSFQLILNFTNNSSCAGAFWLWKCWEFMGTSLFFISNIVSFRPCVSEHVLYHSVVKINKSICIVGNWECRRIKHVVISWQHGLDELTTIVLVCQWILKKIMVLVNGYNVHMQIRDGSQTLIMEDWCQKVFRAHLLFAPQIFFRATLFPKENKCQSLINLIDSFF